MLVRMFRVPRLLDSPNRWNGAHWKLKHKISQIWQIEIRAQALPPSVKPGRRRVEVERHVRSRRGFIRDDDNLRFSVKPLLDAMKRLGWIRDDAREWLELPAPTQHVSEDGRDWTVIKVFDI